MNERVLLVKKLRALAYFQSVAAPLLEMIVEQAQRRYFDAGAAIFHEGDASAGMWLVESGSVKVFKINPDGEEHILHLLGAGSTFNDIAALDGSANPANAAALSNAHVWLLPSATLREALTRDGTMALTVIALLTGRVRSLVKQIEDLALYSVTIRLARFLLKQSDEPALQGPGVTRAAIAAHLATTPESVSRSLRSLEQSGAIRFDRHQLIIEDEARLRAIADL
jgi:CRP-like cAMP-binding protein